MAGELRPTVPTRRPENAHRRRTAPPIVAPTADELAAIERHLAHLPVHSGAVVHEATDLGMLVVEGQHPQTGFDHGAVVRWPAGAWSERLAAFERRQRAAGSWPSLALADGLTQPADLAPRLATLGWSTVSTETVLWTRRPAVVPHLDPMLRIEAVTERTVGEHETIERSIFGLPASGSDARKAGLRAGIADGSLRAYLVRSQGEAVACARLSLLMGLAGLFGIGVVAHRRRQGLGTLVTTIATRAGLASGRPVVWLSVDGANEAAHRLYEGLGFAPTFGWQRWVAPAD